MAQSANRADTRGQHIAVVTTSYPSHAGDAAGHFVASDVSQLLQRGHRVTVLCPNVAEAPAQELPRGAGLHIVRLDAGQAFGWPGVVPRLRSNPTRLLGIATFCQSARRHLQGHFYDRIIAHWLFPAAWPIANGLAPLEIVAHGSDVRLLAHCPRVAAQVLMRSLFARGCQLRFVSAELRETLARRTYGKVARRIRDSIVRPCQIDIGEPLAKDEARRQLHAGREFIAVIVARLIKSKRVDAALRLAPYPAGCRRIVIGSGPLLAQYQKAFPDVEFLGHIPRQTTLHWLAAADVVVSASRSEGAPTVIREARALGTEVWCARCGDVELWAEADAGIKLLPELDASIGQGHASTEES